ncbi:hypothetical protein MMAN_52480 [Mycobacterium mantenii]|uniref:Uncharacterized protein n=1 Tax=Mycobacterium mantenii TaxID=560555 RepID=A0ABM7JZT6_MYCNT|nr:hypothetical protein MMAN_52480 [Mycobacterium mantenii]
MTTNPLSKTKAPVTQDHTGFDRKSVSSVGISEARAIAVAVMMTRKGPITRANMRVLAGVCVEELMAAPLYSVSHWSR